MASRAAAAGAAAAAAAAAAVAASAAVAAAAAAPALEDYQQVDMSKFKLDHHLLHSALAGPHRVEEYKLHVSKVDRTSVMAHARLGPQVCGHPGIAHGGILASLLDDAMGAAFFSARLGSGFTANLSVDYRRPLPAGRDVLVTAAIERVEESTSGSGSKKVYLVGSIVDKEDPSVVYTQGKALFIVKAVPSDKLVAATLAATGSDRAAAGAGASAGGAAAAPLH